MRLKKSDEIPESVMEKRMTQMRLKKAPNAIWDGIFKRMSMMRLRRGPMNKGRVSMLRLKKDRSNSMEDQANYEEEEEEPEDEFEEQGRDCVWIRGLCFDVNVVCI